MSRIPFIEASFYDPDETRIHIEHRLLNHQRKLRAARLMSLKNNPDLEGAERPDAALTRGIMVPPRPNKHERKRHVRR